MRRSASSELCSSGCYMPHLCARTRAACLMRPKAYYPMFADLNGRRCLVIGGGAVAQRKVRTLIRYGARVTVISPTMTKRLAGYARAGTIDAIARAVRPSDLRGAWLVYAATNDERINECVSRAAARQRIFTNVVDQTPLCSFIAPAIARRGHLVVAVSTGGSSPSLAKQLRRDLQALIEGGYPEMLRLLRSLRGVAKRKLPSYQDRKRYFDRLVRGKTFALVKAGRGQAARQEALTLLDRWPGRNGS